MTGPWDNYQADASAADVGPWDKYGGGTQFTGLKAVNAAEMAGRGMTLGVSDYVDALGRYMGDKVAKGLNAAGMQMGPSFDPNASYSYNEALKETRGDVAQYRAANPITANAAEITGGITSPIYGAIGKGVTAATDAAATALPSLSNIIKARYLGYGLQGASAGAAGGAGNAEGQGGGVPTAGDIGQSAGTGAALGGALGVAVPAVAEGAAWGAGKLRDASQGMLDRLPGGQDTGAGRRLANAAGKQGMTADDIRAAVDKMGPEGTIADVGGYLRAAGEQAANQSGDANQAAQVLRNRQFGQAETIRQAALDATGAAHEDELIAKRAVMTRPLYEQSFTPQGGPTTGQSFQINDPTIESILSQPESQKSLQEGMDAIRRDNVIQRATDPSMPDISPMDYALRRNPDSGQWEKVGTPNLRMIDAVKRGYDIMLDSDAPDMVNQRTGTPTNKARQIAAFRDILINRTNDQLPVDPRFGTSTWQAARDQWRQMSKPIEAMNTLDKILGKARDISDVTGQVYGSPNARAKLAGLTQDPAKMAQFQDAIKNQMNFAETNRAVNGNSRTAYRQALNDDTGSDFSGAAVELAKGNPVSFATHILKSLVNSLTGPSPEVASGMSPLFSQNKAEQDAFLNLMRQRARVGSLGANAFPALAQSPGGVGTIAGLAGGADNTGGSNQ